MISSPPNGSGDITGAAWRQWFQEVYDWYAKTGRYTDPAHPQFGRVEPPRATGLLAYADGAGWDPGGGAGYYRWSGSA
jgi:hypothetical protein